MNCVVHTWLSLAAIFCAVAGKVNRWPKVDVTSWPFATGACRNAVETSPSRAIQFGREFVAREVSGVS